MLGYILCEKGMIYKGIKYKENGVYTRVDGFIVFLNLESLITNMWDKMVKQLLKTLQKNKLNIW